MDTTDPPTEIRPSQNAAPILPYATPGKAHQIDRADQLSRLAIVSAVGWLPATLIVASAGLEGIALLLAGILAIIAIIAAIVSMRTDPMHNRGRCISALVLGAMELSALLAGSVLWGLIPRLH